MMVKFCPETHSQNQKHVIPRHGKHIESSSHKSTSCCAVGVSSFQIINNKWDQKMNRREDHAKSSTQIQGIMGATGGGAE